MLTKETIEEAEVAKNHLLNSSLDDRCKKSLLRLLNTATMATNGISTEEKIQKITESIQGLVLSQITFLDTIDKKIEKANLEKCENCKAMKHADEVEEEERKKQLIEDWKKANGISENQLGNAKDDQKDNSWTGVIKRLITQPAAWVFLTVLTISPYGVDIVKAILEFCSK